MKIKIYSKETCLEKAREKFAGRNYSEEMLLDALPDCVFGNEHNADDIEDSYEIKVEENERVLFYCVDKMFAEEVRPDDSFDFKRDCKHTNYEIACGINNLSDSDFIEVFAELGILNGKTLGETVKWLGEVLEEIRMAQCEEV